MFVHVVKLFNDQKEKSKVDANERAKRIVDLATGRTEESKVAGRHRSGKARAESLTPERRREIAKKAAATRWAAV